GLASGFLLLLALSVERREPAPEVRALAEQSDTPGATSASPQEGAPPASAASEASLPPQAALARLRELQRQNPKDARYPAGLARLAFEQGRPREGLSQFRKAAALDKSLRRDPVLVGHVISSLGNDAVFESAEELLKEFGRQTKPFVTEAAARHENRKVRTRARRLLEDWQRRPFLRWL
ncbi:MAG TPA: hypothetical protein VGF45_14330, partial [Polyangia bacterium]